VNQLQPHPDYLGRVSGIEDITRRKYAAQVVNLDDGIGRVLGALDEYKLAENTLVIFITDHGGTTTYGGSNVPFRDGKATLFEGGIRVPCLMRWPGRIQPGSETDAISSSLDIFPTICALSGVNHAGALDGRDISGLFADVSAGDSSRELYWELGPHDDLGRGRWRALRQGAWKYVLDDDGREYLFNIEADPYEKDNAAAREPTLFSRLRARSLVRSAMGPLGEGKNLREQ